MDIYNIWVDLKPGQRDLEFAHNEDLPVIPVVLPPTIPVDDSTPQASVQSLTNRQAVVRLDRAPGRGYRLAWAAWL